MSYAQRLQQGPPRELELEYALCAIGLPLARISLTQFRDAIAGRDCGDHRDDRRTERAAGVTYSAVRTVRDTLSPILFCVNRGSAANSIIKANAEMSVNGLTAGRSDIFRHFSGTGYVSMSKRVASDRWQYSSTGTPYFNSRAASVACRRASLTTPFAHNIGVTRGSNAERSRNSHAPHHSGTARLKADT